MDQKYDRLYPSAPFLKKNKDLEGRLEKKLNDAISFNDHIYNIKEMITHFKDKYHKSKKRYKNYKAIDEFIESVDSIVIIGEISISITFSVTGIRLLVLPMSAGIACTLSLGNNVLQTLITNKYNKHKKQYGRDQQTIKFSDKLYRKSLQGSVTDKNEYENLCNIFTKCVDENKNEPFFKKYEKK